MTNQIAAAVNRGLGIAGLVLLPLAARADFTWSYLRTVAPANGWQFVSGQFAGTNLTDLAGYYQGNGSIWIGRNTGFSFVWSQVGFVQPANGWGILAGQFGGTSLSDLVGYYPANGSVWVGLNSAGSKFTWKQVRTVAPASGWLFVAGQFAGTALDDLVAYYENNGSVWIGRNTGSTFDWKQVDTLVPAVGWRFDAGQFGGSSLADLAATNNTYFEGKIMIGRNEGGSAFAWKEAASLSRDRWSLVAGQFGGNPLADLVAVVGRTGKALIGTNNGTTFTWKESTFAPYSYYVPGQFAGSSLTDLVEGRPGAQLWLGENKGATQ